MRALAVITALALIACGGGGSTSGAPGGGGSTGEGGMTSAGGSSVGAGGEPLMNPGALVDDGLIARYFLDEATTGQPSEVIDHTTDPLDLALTWDTTGEPAGYFEDPEGHRGIAFPAITRNDRASIAIDGTKIQTRLAGSATMTYELVADIQAVEPLGSRLCHIGFDTDHTLSLETNSITRLEMSVNHDLGGLGAVSLADLGRAVFHGVVDTREADPQERVRLYVNASRVPNLAPTPPDQNDTLVIDDGRHFVIGNREIGGRTIQGTIYYAAIYDAALTAEQVLFNTTLLLANDDTP